MTTFKLKCVGCKQVETRDAALCHEEPMCSKCYMPMILVSVSHRSPKEQAEAPRLSKMNDYGGPTGQ